MILVLVFLVGCGSPAQEIDNARLAACFADAAYECWVAENRQAAPEKKKCCGKCGGTGKVLSGDRLALVPCDCDPSCECKGGCDEEGCKR